MATELQPGDVFAGHRIDGVTGRGGMGVVYRATQLDLARTIALKLIAPSLAQDPGFRERFIRETRVAANLDHPNVIPVFYAGEEDGRLYLAMRYVDGDDLRTLVRREGPLLPARAARIVNQVGAALDAAHAHGIVHRDVKPANILLGAGEHAYLTDFGLTKRLDSDAGVTHPGGWVGTMGFVSPEQIRGEPVDARSDVYALGCVLHYALTGEAPHERDTDEATLWAHLNAPVPELTGDVPAAFGDVIAKALAKRPADRYQSAGDLGHAALAAAGLAADAPPAGIVATGAAAPGGAGGAPIHEETVISPVPAGAGDPAEAQTVHVPGAAGRDVKRSRPAGALLALAAISILIVGGVVALLIGSGDSAKQPGSSSTQTTTTVPGHVVGTPIAAGPRPNDIVATRSSVWSTSYASSRLTRIDTRTGKLLTGPKVGVGAGSIAAGFRQLWIAKQTTHKLLRLSQKTGRRSGPPVPLPPGNPVEVVADPAGVWVGLRPATVARVDPVSGTVADVHQIPGGVLDIAVGDGAVWIVNRGHNSMIRLDEQTAQIKRIVLGKEPRGLAVGYGHVWVVNSGDDTLWSISTKPPYRPDGRYRTGDTPSFVDVGGGSVWVTNNIGGTLTRVDAASKKVVGEVDVGGNPFALSVNGRDVWFTSPDQGTVTHVRPG